MYPMVIAETDEEITYQPCAMCLQDAMVEHEGKGVCREHYLEMVVVMDEQGPDVSPAFCGEQPIEDSRGVTSV